MRAMAEYIEREALLAKLEERRDFLFKENGDYDHYTNGFDEAVCRVEDFPTVEVEPVRHGWWEDKPTGRYGQWQSWCSACGKHSGIGGIESNRLKPYCPNCGCKMDGGESHETEQRGV